MRDIQAGITRLMRLFQYAGQGLRILLATSEVIQVIFQSKALVSGFLLVHARGTRFTDVIADQTGQYCRHINAGCL